MDDLYPQNAPYNKGYLPVDTVHQLYYEEFGNPDGIPVVYLHGGPGGGHAPWFHQMFDPKAFRIVIYDQRGAGDSKPFGRIADNSPDLLVADLETLRAHLGIDTWHVSGGSWGSTLALLYAEAHPDKARSLTLRGIFMMRQRELDFLYRQGDTFFPEEFGKLRDFIPEAERGDLILAYFNRVSQGDERAARVWTRYESACSHLVPLDEAALTADSLTHIVGMALMETHFFLNHRFQPDDRILKDIGKIRHVPMHIVQGRYDNVCPPYTAWDLKNAMPGATMDLVLAGHATRDPEICKALLHAHDRIRDNGSPVKPVVPAPGNGPPANP